MQTQVQSQAAIMVINTGGRDIVIDKLTVRGQEADWNGATQNITYISNRSINISTTLRSSPHNIDGRHDTPFGVELFQLSKRNQ